MMRADPFCDEDGEYTTRCQREARNATDVDDEQSPQRNEWTTQETAIRAGNGPAVLFLHSAGSLADERCSPEARPAVHRCSA